MSAGIGILGLLVIAAVAVVVIFVIIRIIQVVAGFRFGHASLVCPHCRKETSASERTCRQCGQEL